MRQLAIDDFVRLSWDIPELALHQGQVGVVRARQCGGSQEDAYLAYEVEFHCVGRDCQVRTLLRPEQIQAEDGSLR